MRRVSGTSSSARREMCKTFIAGSIPAVASGAGFRASTAEVFGWNAEVCAAEVCLGLAGEELAEARGGELLELALVVLADVSGGHRFALPAADLHDHLERHSPLLQSFRGVPASAVLDEVAEPCLGELCAKDLVAAVPRELGEASSVAVQKERLFALEICRALSAPVRSLETEVVAEGALGLLVERDEAIGSSLGL